MTQLMASSPSATDKGKQRPGNALITNATFFDEAMPFYDAGVRFSDFGAVVAVEPTDSTEAIAARVAAVISASDAEIARRRTALAAALERFTVQGTWDHAVSLMARSATGRT